MKDEIIVTESDLVDRENAIINIADELKMRIKPTDQGISLVIWDDDKQVKIFTDNSELDTMAYSDEITSVETDNLYPPLLL